MRIALITPGGVDRSGTHRVIPCLLWLIERLAAEPAVPATSLLDNLAEQLQQAANLRRLNVRRRMPGSTSAGSSPATPRRAAPRTAPGGNPQH